MKNKYVIMLIVILLLISSVFFYLSSYYRAVDVEEYLKSDELVEVKEDSNGYLFDGIGEDTLLIFYTGGKVEFTSYAPLMNRLAKEGVDTYLVRMPFNLAIFDSNAADKVIKNYKYDNYYIGGHSLGGAMAANYASKHDVKGLILLAAYSTKKVDCRVLSIYGSNDGVLNMDKYYENKKNLPDDTLEVKIEGGNHAYFGNYGEQKKDGKASISRDGQQEITAIKIIDFIREN